MTGIMTIEESLTNLKTLQADYQQFHDDVWQDPESYGIMAESLQVAISTMSKYQKIERILNWREYDVDPNYHTNEDMINEIREVMKDENIDR